MALPDNFSPWEHLFEQLMNSYNPMVEGTFTGLEFGDLSTALGGMYVACFIQEDDTVDIVILRLFLYFFVYQGNLPTPVYGTPTPDYQSNITFSPQVILKFLEDPSLALTENSLPRTEARISFRLVNFTSATITPSEALTLANSIKTLFATGGGYTWEKGTNKYTYYDDSRGYDFRLYCDSESTAISIITKVLEIQGHAFDETLLSDHTNRKTYPVIPPTQEVYGKQRRGPRKRPITQVRFRRAELLINGMPNAIVLVDLSGRSRGLVTPY